MLLNVAAATSPSLAAKTLYCTGRLMGAYLNFDESIIN